MSATDTSSTRIDPVQRPHVDGRLFGSLRLAWSYVPALLLLAGIAVHCASTGREPIEFTRDPAAFHLTHPFVGAVSNLGILIWTATAAVTLFSAMVLARITRRDPLGPFLFHVGILSAWLMLDDLFMFHERIAPDAIGLPQPALFAGYALWLGGILVRYRTIIEESHHGLLLMALAFFALSAGLDQLAPGQWYEWRYMMLIEDGAKLLGIVGWFAYFAPLSLCALIRR